MQAGRAVIRRRLDGHTGLDACGGNPGEQGAAEGAGGSRGSRHRQRRFHQQLSCVCEMRPIHATACTGWHAALHLHGCLPNHTHIYQAPTWRSLNTGQMCQPGQEPRSGAARKPLQAAPVGLHQLAHHFQRAAVVQRLAAVAQGVGSDGQRARPDAQRIRAVLHGAPAGFHQPPRLLHCQQEEGEEVAPLAAAGRRRLGCSRGQLQTVCVAAKLWLCQCRCLARPLLGCCQCDRVGRGGGHRCCRCCCYWVAAHVRVAAAPAAAAAAAAATVYLDTVT